MHHPSIPRLATVAALALTAIIPAAACGSEPVSPLPIQPGTATPSRTVSPPVAASTPPANAPPKGQNPPAVQRPKASPRPTGPTSACKGAVVYPIDLRNAELALVRPMCFATGGVLQLRGIGPGLVTVDPASLAPPSYEAGVVDIHFVRRGTVTVKIPQNGQTYTITVVIR